MAGRDGNDPLFLQAKEAQESVLERFVGRSTYNNHGQRVVAGQRLMQAASDIFLGWQRVTGFDGQVRDFYVRQLRDWKGSVDVDTMSSSLMTLYSRICGATLARAHARSGDRIAVAAYLGKNDTFDRAIADFANAYADQNERDYLAFVDAVRSGRLDAQSGLWPLRAQGPTDHEAPGQQEGRNMKTVIAGGVAAGASTGARPRRLDESAEIVILPRDEEHGRTPPGSTT